MFHHPDHITVGETEAVTGRELSQNTHFFKDGAEIQNAVCFCLEPIVVNI